jgi:hypothetical protein
MAASLLQHYVGHCPLYGMHRINGHNFADWTCIRHQARERKRLYSYSAESEQGHTLRQNIQLYGAFGYFGFLGFHGGDYKDGGFWDIKSSLYFT